MRSINMIVIHCSATRPDQDFTMEKLEASHRAQGWKGCGYHYYIRRDGTVYNCRPLSQVGAHAKGFNAHSVGICYEGGLDIRGQPADTRTPEQKEAMHRLVAKLKWAFPLCSVLGHRDLFGVRKACPSFNVQDEEW